MINQGYSYKVINKINLAGENLFYTKQDEQQDLLQKVLAANESAADEEDAPTGSGLKPSGSSTVFRTQGNLGSLSGADEGLYMEIQRKKGGDKDKIRHPLFKKFYSTK